MSIIFSYGMFRNTEMMNDQIFDYIIVGIGTKSAQEATFTFSRFCANR
jgi:hypothetical protein